MEGEDGHEELTPAEEARARRRDRAGEGQARAGMRTGLAKQFKQVLDAQVRRAAETADRKAADKGTDKHSAETSRPAESSARKRAARKRVQGR